jgi:hypothetical protein
MPLITVKQPDGTLTKITLEEFMKQRATPPAPVQAAPVLSSASLTPIAPVSQEVMSSVSKEPEMVKPILSPAPLPKPVVSPAPAEMKAAPVKPPAPPVPAPIARPSDKSFIKDLESPSLSSSNGEPSSDYTPADELIKNLTFSVSNTNLNRLRGAIQSRLKGVRSEEETQKILLRSPEEGGLGLIRSQAEEIIRSCEKHEALMVPGPGTLSTSTPFNAFKHEMPKVEHRALDKAETGFVRHPSHQQPSTGMTSERPKSRPVVTDVTFKPMSIGPIEEISSMTLVDFRRLSPVNRDAALRFEQKFTNLKAESIVLFFEALDAWHSSSLYREYTDRALNALLYRKSLDQVLLDAKGITLDEVAALVGMEKRLVF